MSLYDKELYEEAEKNRKAGGFKKKKPLLFDAVAVIKTVNEEQDR